MSDLLTVNLGERSYPIVFGTDLSREIRAQAADWVSSGRKFVVITDRHVAEKQGGWLREIFDGAPTLVLAAGEETKSLVEFGRVLDFLAEHRVDRSGTLVAVGGGVIGDLGGFAASAFLRGLDFVQIPTTLLAMVDSSVGGKTGINLKAGKNLVGAFHQPKAVFVATSVLSTLPPREFAAGMAEVIKYGLLGDAELFTKLESAPLTVASSNLSGTIRRCCAIKAGIVEADERELAKEGGRALLNLGHTFGHAIEQVTGYGAYLHGEAVAIGLNAATRLSHKLGLVGLDEVARVERILGAHSLPVQMRQGLPMEGLMSAMARDKKVRAGMPRFVVLNKLGEAATRSGVDSRMVEAVWREVGAV